MSLDNLLVQQQNQKLLFLIIIIITIDNFQILDNNYFNSQQNPKWNKECNFTPYQFSSVEIVCMVHNTALLIQLE